MGSGGFRPSSLLDGEGCMLVAHVESCAGGGRNYSLAEMAYVEDLAKRLAAFGLLHPNRNRASLFTTPNTGKVVRCPCAVCVKPNFENQSRREAMAAKLSEMYYGYGGGTYLKGNIAGRNDVWGGWEFGCVERTHPPFHRQDFSKFSPVTSQAATFIGRPNVTIRREFPSQLNTRREPVSIRKCKGTGVFLPRIADNTKELGTDPGTMVRGNKFQRPQQLERQQLELTSLGISDDVAISTPEQVLVLPQEWTY